MSTPSIGSFVQTPFGGGYFAGVTGSLYAVDIQGKVIGVMPSDVTLTHVPGYIASNDGDEVRYYAMRANAVAWAGEGDAKVLPALVPVGATMHDVFDSLEDFDASKPATA